MPRALRIAPRTGRPKTGRRLAFAGATLGSLIALALTIITWTMDRPASGQLVAGGSVFALGLAWVGAYRAAYAPFGAAGMLIISAFLLLPFHLYFALPTSGLLIAAGLVVRYEAGQNHP